MVRWQIVQDRGFDSAIGRREARERCIVLLPILPHTRALRFPSERHPLLFMGEHSQWTGLCHTDVHFWPSTNLHRLFVYRHACTDAIDFLNSFNLKAINIAEVNVNHSRDS